MESVYVHAKTWSLLPYEAQEGALLVYDSLLQRAQKVVSKQTLGSCFFLYEKGHFFSEDLARVGRDVPVRCRGTGQRRFATGGLHGSDLYSGRSSSSSSTAAICGSLARSILVLYVSTTQRVPWGTYISRNLTIGSLLEPRNSGDLSFEVPFSTEYVVDSNRVFWC